MKEVCGWFVDDRYDGCRNCMFRDDPGVGCEQAKEVRKVAPICPFWQEASANVKEETV